MKKQFDTMYRIFNNRTNSYERSNTKNFWNRIAYVKNKLVDLAERNYSREKIEDLEIHVFKIIRVDDMNANVLVNDKLNEIKALRNKENRKKEIWKHLNSIFPDIHSIYQLMNLYNNSQLNVNKESIELINEYKQLNK
jgi:hypothetical protein